MGLAGFGKSSYSRKYSVIFSSSFAHIIQDYNCELVDRFFRSANDMESTVRLAIAQNYFYIGKYIKSNFILIPKLLKNVSKIIG